jgi:hypothetical protein
MEPSSIGGEVEVAVAMALVIEEEHLDAVMSTHASVLVDSVGPPSAEVYRTATSFP